MKNTDFERIERIMQIKQIPTFAEFSRQIGLKNPQNFTDLKRGKYKITRNFATKIHEIYPDLSTLWILSGEGPMYVGNVEQHNVNGDNLAGGSSKETAPCGMDERLAALLESQQATIREQAQTIKELTILLTHK